MSIQQKDSILQQYYGKNPEKERSIEDEKKDNDFEERGNKATSEGTEKLKNGVSGALGYGKFSKPEKGNQKAGDGLENKQENEIKKQKQENNIYYPIFERLLSADKISKVTFDSLSQQLIEGKPDLGKIQFDDKNEKKLITDVIEKIDLLQVEDSKGNLEEFLKDFKDISKKIEKKEFSGLEEELYNKIGKNYIKVETGNAELDKKENMSTAIKTTANQIIKDYKNIPTDKITYEKALKNINGDNAEKQFEGLHTLYLLAVTNEGAGGTKMEGNKKKITEGINKRKENIIKHAKELTIKMEKAKEINNKELYNKLLEEKLNLVDEGIEIDEGIFGGDRGIETNDENPDNISENK